MGGVCWFKLVCLWFEVSGRGDFGLWIGILWVYLWQVVVSGWRVLVVFELDLGSLI